MEYRFAWEAALIERKTSAATESIAEGVHASLALIAVVLLARAQSGVFERTPPAWFVISISALIWVAATAATRWSPPVRQRWFAAWRNCVSPILIVLILGGRGSVPLLLGELLVIAVGIATVGYFAFRAGESSSEPVASPSVVPLVESALSAQTPEPVAQVQAVAPVLAPSPASGPEPACVPVPVSAEEESGHLEESGVIQRLDPAHDGAFVQSSSAREVTDESLHMEESSETESWTRREFDGEVSIEAVILARFAEGAKLAVLHLPFVPPLPELPQIECEPLDSGCDVTITMESAFRHGAKLNVTRRSAGPAESIPIGIVIYTSVEEEIES